LQYPTLAAVTKREKIAIEKVLSKESVAQKSLRTMDLEAKDLLETDEKQRE